MVVGGTQQLTATTTDAGGASLTGRLVTWVSSNTSVLTVSPEWLYGDGDGGGSGHGDDHGDERDEELSADADDHGQSSAGGNGDGLRPDDADGGGRTQQLTATTTDAGGASLTGRLVTWVSSNTSVLTVSPSGYTVTVTAVGPGTATITATSETKSSLPTPTITVNPVPVATVTVSAPTTPMVVGGTQQLTATTTDAGGASLTGRLVTWVSSNTSVLTVSPSGYTVTVTAVGPGTATITATSETKSSLPTPTITVNPVPVATVTVSAPTTPMVVGGTQQLTATTTDAGGASLTGRLVTWVSSNTSVLTVSPSGYTVTVTAVGPGTATITATSETKSSLPTPTITVNPVPVATVTVSAPTTPMVVGGTQQLTATTTDAGGASLTGRLVTWVSSNTSVLTVSASGSPATVTAVGVGTATITATSETVNSLPTPAITVNQAPVATVTVSAPTTPMVVGGTQQLTATTTDAGGASLTGRLVTWVSSNTAVLTVSPSGSTATVTAVGVGTATITATSETKSSLPTPTITVNPVPVATVTVSAPTTPMVVGGTQPLTAVTKDANNITLTGRTVSWVSSNTAVLTVSPASGTTGATTVTAVGVGTATITATSESVTSSPTPTITVNPMLASGPLRASTVNPRYFADPTGRVVYLTGSEYWNTIEDNGPSNPPPVFDYSAFLDFLQSHNHNFTRLFMWEQARWSSLSTIDHWFSPNLYVRTGPGIGIDSAPKFDLTQINPAYLARVRQRVIDAGARGIYVSVMLFNGWAVEFKAGTGKNPWLSHPFNAANNINNINGDPNSDQSGQEIQTLSIPAVTALQDTYVRAVIDAVNDLDNVIYEISNETNSNPAADAWQYHMINLIRSYEAGKPKQHPIGMTVPWPSGSNSEVLNSTADWVAMNGDLNNPPAADGSKVSLWDTDHLCGICGDMAWPWRSLTRGHNTLLMDGYNGAPGYTDPAYDPTDPKWEVIRKNMGYARSYALRMDLANARPRSDLASSSFCLAVVGSEYLVFNAEIGNVSVNLSGVSGSRTVEWFNPATGQTTAGGTVAGGGSVSFTPPFSGMAVLYIHP